MVKKNLYLTVFIFLIIPMLADAKDIKVYTDDDWFPYVYADNDKSVGIQVEITREALIELGYQPTFIPCPWKRCLLGLQNGKVDAVVSASYTQERAAYAHYPIDAANTKRSAWRLGEVDYVLVTKAGDTYDFNGDFTTIPQPVSVALGASIGGYLKDQGVRTTENVRNIINIRMLLAQRTPSIAMNLPLAKDLNSAGEFAGRLKIHNKPLRTKSYFFVFSKLSSVTETERQNIWKAIVDIRSDEKRLLNIFNKYKALHPKD